MNVFFFLLQVVPFLFLFPFLPHYANAQKCPPLLQKAALFPFTITPIHSIHFAQTFLPQLKFRLQTLSTITETPGLNRPYLSNAAAQARTLLLTYMRESNLEAHIDSAGNVIGRVECPNVIRPYLAIGSHHDTVPNAGKFDGIYGVLAAITVASSLVPYICSFPFHISVLAFDDEEGNNNFATTNLGAKAFVGLRSSDIPHRHAFDVAHARAFPGANILDARAHAPPLAYLELHIEQGPILETADASLGSVSAIAGQTRMRVLFSGRAAHAGTTPMEGRVDALAAAAGGVLAVEHIGRSGKVVATVGSLVVPSGASNVVPGHVEMTVDVRSGPDSGREEAVRRIKERLTQEGKKRGVGVVIQVVHDVAAVSMTPWIVEALKEVVDGGELVSGAGHDAQIMARVTDVGMIFVRCRGGVSHHADEFVSDEDLYRGVVGLYHSVEAIKLRLQPAPF